MYRLTEKVDSSNAESVEKDIFAAYESNGELSIDAGALNYISSAGLRVLLKLRQKQGDELLIIDMAEISYGNPIYDLASSYYAHMLNPRQDPDSVMTFLNVTPEIAIRLWNEMMI